MLRSSVIRSLEEAALTGVDQTLPPTIRVVSGHVRLGKKRHYYFNYSGNDVTFTYSYASGKDPLTNRAVAHSQQITLKPSDMTILEQR